MLQMNASCLEVGQHVSDLMQVYPRTEGLKHVPGNSNRPLNSKEGVKWAIPNLPIEVYIVRVEASKIHFTILGEVTVSR
jgi:hypothetical protein